MSNLNNDPVKFLIACGTVILVANATTSFASFISSTSSNVNAAIAVASPLLAPLMIFSGTFLKNKF
jgi:ABC-type multidrug transport system permease subunit